MGNNYKRPVDHGIFSMRLPIGGWVSILHRITGVMLVTLLPLVFYLFQLSLLSLADFDRVVRFLHTYPVRMVLVALIWLFVQHFYSGVRHLLLDIDVGIARKAGHSSARWVLGASLATTLMFAFLLL